MADVGTRLIFENERIKVWEFTLAPGESIGAHTHDHDYFFTPLARDTSSVEPSIG